MLTGLRLQGLDQMKIYPRMPNKTLWKTRACHPVLSIAGREGLFAIRQEPPRELKKVTEKPACFPRRYFPCKGRISTRPQGAFRRSPGFSVLLLSQILPPRETVGLPRSSTFLLFMVLAQDINTYLNRFGGTDLSHSVRGGGTHSLSLDKAVLDASAFNGNAVCFSAATAQGR